MSLYFVMVVCLIYAESLALTESQISFGLRVPIGNRPQISKSVCLFKKQVCRFTPSRDRRTLKDFFCFLHGRDELVESIENLSLALRVVHCIEEPNFISPVLLGSDRVFVVVDVVIHTALYTLLNCEKISSDPVRNNNPKADHVCPVVTLLWTNQEPCYDPEQPINNKQESPL